jgi:hypothetical protein
VEAIFSPWPKPHFSTAINTFSTEANTFKQSLNGLTMGVDIQPLIADNDVHNLSCLASIIKAQGNNYDSILIQQGKQTYVYSIGSSGNVAYASCKLDEPICAIYARMQEAKKNIMPHLRESLFKYDATNNLVFFNSQEMSLNDILKKA